MREKFYDIVVVGGGQAGRRAAEGARTANPAASIAIVGEERHLPYDRPPLSKTALANADAFGECVKRSQGFYDHARIDVWTSQRARRLDLGSKRIVTDDGTTFAFERVVLATGSRARRLPAPQDISDRVLCLRTREDADALRKFLQPAARIVVVGAGLIGLEVAATAVRKGAHVTVLESASTVLSRVLPSFLSAEIEMLHRAAGVEFYLGQSVGALRVADNGLVALEVGGQFRTFEAVVVGIGVIPCAEIAEPAGLAVPDGILVDASGATSHPDVFAAGEVAQHPVAGCSDPIRLESWQVAELQAHAAGATAAGRRTEHLEPPWFWSDQYDTNIQILGAIPPHAQWVARGVAQADNPFMALALDQHRMMLGAVAINSGRDISIARRLLSQGRPIIAERVADPSTNWRDWSG